MDSFGPETPRRQENVQSQEVTSLKNVKRAEDGPSSGSSFDQTPTKSKTEDSKQAKNLPLSDQAVETTKIMSNTDKYAMQQQEKRVVKNSTLDETSKHPFDTTSSAPMQIPDRCPVTEDQGESKTDSTGFQNERSNEKCQFGKLKECTEPNYETEKRPNNSVVCQTTESLHNIKMLYRLLTIIKVGNALGFSFTWMHAHWAPVITHYNL